MSADADVSDLDKFIVDLGKFPADALDDLRKVAAKAGHNMKTDAAQRVTGLAHAPHYPRSISYDVRTRFGAVEVEAGPDKNRTQGALGTLIENGSRNNPPRPHMGPALVAEAPKFEAACGDILETLVDER